MTRTNEVGETRAMGNAVPTTDAQPVYPHTMRLQRFLARAGVASRRGSEDLMTAGRVTVNGKVARASYDVKVGDVIALHFGERVLAVEVLDVSETAGKSEASLLYRAVNAQQTVLFWVRPSYVIVWRALSLRPKRKDGF